MKKEQEIRKVLISNTIRLIAEGGFEKATTKAIVHSGDMLPDIKMNEVHIYRLFGSKEDLYSVAFASIDSEMFFSFKRCFESHVNEDCETRAMFRAMFDDAWGYIMRNEEKCRYYTRYYYSIYFKDKSLNDHNELFEEIVTGFAPLFKEGADVKSIMHSVFTALLDFAVRVYNEDLENVDYNADHIFNVIYCMMLMCLKTESNLITI